MGEQPARLAVGTGPVRVLLTLDETLWASCDNQVTVLDATSLHAQVRSSTGTPCVASTVGFWGGQSALNPITHTPACAMTFIAAALLLFITFGSLPS